jgi:L,D-transpeptidase ErfK/SrfK
MRVARVFLGMVLGVIPALSLALDNSPPLSSILSGSEFTYTAQRGDSVPRLALRFAINSRNILRDNGIKGRERLKEGRELKIDNRHIVPEALVDDGIVINLPARLLFHLRERLVTDTYPIAVGKPDWPTPSGDFEVVQVEANKTWLVPKSIQAEMRAAGRKVITRIEPGPKNPLGKYWVGISLPGIGIHGTTAPASIGGFRSHGCIRLHPDHSKDFYKKVTLGELGSVVYEPVLMARMDDGRIFLEISQDAYRRRGDPYKAAQAIAEREGLTDSVDWQRVKDVIREHAEVAREVTASSHQQAKGGDT